MAGFNDTVDLERAFLRAITNNLILARTYLNQGSEDLFTSDPRKCIFALAQLALKDSNSILTASVFTYEIGKRFKDQNDASDYICEWNMIDGVASYDPPEVLIRTLKTARLGRQALMVSESVLNLLASGDIENAVSTMKREAMLMGGELKNDRPLVSLKDTEAREQLISDKIKCPEKFLGLKTGFKTFDDFTGGLFPGELTLIAGITGLGKSTLCKQISKGLTTLNGHKNVLHIANEEYLEQVQYKYDSVFTGIPYLDFKRATISSENLLKWKQYMEKDMCDPNRGQIYIKEVPAFTDVSLIEQQYRLLENKGIKIDAIVIDHLPHVVPIQKSWGENDERFKAAADCKELARSLRVPVITPTQAATEVEKKQMSGHRASKLDVYGSKGQVHVANTFWIITYKGTDDTQTNLPDYLRDVYWLNDIKKNRDGPPFYFQSKHEVQIGCVTEIQDPSKKASNEAASLISGIVAESKTQTPKMPIPEIIAEAPIQSITNTGARDSSMSLLGDLDENTNEEDEDSDEKVEVKSNDEPKEAECASDNGKIRSTETVAMIESVIKEAESGIILGDEDKEGIFSKKDVIKMLRTRKVHSNHV